MCCCGPEHDNDPSYKSARSAACCTLTTEIIALVINGILYAAVILAGILVCSIANWTAVGGIATGTVGQKGYSYSYTKTCAANTDSYHTYSAITTIADCEAASKQDSYGGDTICSVNTATTVTDQNLPTGCVCDETVTPNVLKLNQDTNTVNPTYQTVALCHTVRKYRRLRHKHNMSMPANMELFTPTKIPQIVSYLLPGFHSTFIEKNVPKLHKGRRLDACGDDPDCKKLRESSKDGCSAAETIISLFLPNVVFTILGVVFFGITSCGDCCKTCCGGYQRQMKFAMVFSIISSVWGLLNTILHFILYTALAHVRDIAKTTGLSPNAVTLIDGLATWKLLATLFHALLMILRAISAFFMFRAQQKKHSSNADQKNVEMQVVTAQGVVIQGKV